MQVTGYPHGRGGLGLRVRPGDRDRFFDRRWRQVVLDISGHRVITVSISDSFWRDCPELRSNEIGRWLQQSGLAPWPRGKPPKLLMEHAYGNRFEVTLPDLP